VLSVFDTLKETLLLWVRNFWYLVVLVLVIGTPVFVFEHYDHFPRHSQLSAIALLFGLIGLFSTFVLIPAKAAAILGLLRRESPRETVFAAVCSGIHKHTWTLLRLMILIGLTFIPFGLIISIVVHLFGANKYVLIIGMGFYLVLIKYALAYPLVVVDNFNAGDALWRSWTMTKGHFWYVLGCYLFLGLGQWLIHWTITSPVNSADSGLGWAWLPVQFGLMLIDALWIILSWCMYLRIKETDAASPSEAVLS
jgi:hypothetical protein